jgi:integrase
MALNKLTAVQVRNAKPGDKLSDGGGLRLDVDANGNRSWVFRYKSPVTGKERYLGLGSLNLVALIEAREKAKECRGQIATGIDPLEAKKVMEVATRPITTFEQYATAWIAAHEAGWKNPVHRKQWSQTMKDYAYPIIGSMAIDAVSTEDVLTVLRPIWSEIPETARRVRGRMEKILSAAKSEGLRKGENPAAWHDHLVNILPKKPKGGHHAALPYELAPAFWKSLREDTSMGSRALQFIMLTAVRFNVAVPAMSTEINLDKALWDVPQERMKMDEEDYQIPLVDAAVELVKGREGLLFPSPLGGGELTSTTLLKVGKRHANGVPITTHGWRSTFRDWVGDETDADWDVGEAALSHKTKSKTQAAYRRRTALEKRRALFQGWYEYLNS